MNNNSFAKKEKLLLVSIFIVYCTVLVIVLVERFFVYHLIIGDPIFNPVMLPRRFNLIPFHTIKTYIIDYGGLKGSNITGNILVFLPLGVYVQLFSQRKKAWTGILLCALISVGVETMQFALATGSFDVDDIILNTLGGLLGVVGYQLIKAFCKGNMEKTHTFIASTVLIFPSFLISFIRFLIIGTYFDWTVMAIHLLYLIFLFPFLRGAARWKIIYIFSGIVVFGLFFYGFLIRYI